MLLQNTFKANDQFVIENGSQLMRVSKPLSDKFVNHLTLALSNIYFKRAHFDRKRRNNAVC